MTDGTASRKVGHDDPTLGTPARATTAERMAAALIGCTAGVIGGVAVFRTENELGAAGLFVLAGAFLIFAIFGLVPTRIRIGDHEVTVGRAALNTLERVVKDSDIDVQERVVDAFADELAVQGLPRPQADAVDSMVTRFERYAGSTAPREVYSSLLDSGWNPSTPPKSTYVRWTYKGKKELVSLFQRSEHIVAASSRLLDFARNLDGAVVRAPKNDVVFSYGDDVSVAIDAAEAIRRFAEGEPTAG